MLEQAIVEATTAEAQLRARLAGLVDRRNDLLIDGSDDAVDAVEAELDGITRQLDRLELRLPLLRIRHAEQLAAEQRNRREADFAAAVSARVSAAVAVDAALARLGPAFRLLMNAERRLTSVGVPVGSTARRDLVSAIRFMAPEFERAIGIPHELLLEESRPLAEAERERWARVERAGGVAAGPPARVAADRAPPVRPVTADDLERSGRYGKTIDGGGQRLGAGWSDTDGDGEQEVGDAVAA